MPAKTKGKGGRRSNQKNRAAGVSASTRADTIFPVARCNRYFKTGRYSERFSSSAGAFMAGVLEYITAEILEASGEIAVQEKFKTIKPRHINLGIRSDSEMQKLFTNVLVHEGGRIPHIEHFLLPEKQKKQIEATQEM